MVDSVDYIKSKIEKTISTFTEKEKEQAINYIINNKKRKAIDQLG